MVTFGFWLTFLSALGCLFLAVMLGEAHPNWQKLLMAGAAFLALFSIELDNRKHQPPQERPRRRLGTTRRVYFRH